jgi:serine/threonine protein kinase
MSVAGTLLHFGLKQVFDIGTKELFGWIEERFTDSSQRIVKAVFEANQRAWKVVGLALNEETFTGWLRNPIRDGDLKAARKQILAIIASTPNSLGLSSVELHNRAAADLTGLRKRNGLSAAVMAASAESLKRFSDPAALAEELLQAAANSPDELSADAPHLAAVLRLAPDGRTGIFEAMCRHFFRAIVAKDEDLSRRLTHDQIRSLAATVDMRTAGILDQFDVLFDAIANLEGKVDTGFAGVNEKLDAQAEKLSDIQRRLAEPRKPGVSYTTEDEREFLSRAREEFRRDPERITANGWERLGDAMNAARMYPEAGEAHETAARTAQASRDTATEAANHFAAYLDACEAGDWLRASERLWEAVALDATNYRPFDHRRYKPVRILGGGAFGTVFLCLDQYDLDENDQPMQVAIKSFRTELLDRSLTKVFAEARTLKALGHRSIIGVIDQGFGNPDKQTHPYLVLEYFPGITLDLHVAGFGSLALTDFFTIARQVAEAVYAAHTRSRPVFHRDLKPSNIMILKNPDGTWIVKVIDFGLAVRAAVAREGKGIPPANQSTRDKSVTGTLKYAPPEQTGELQGVEVGPYSDVYSFGKTCLDVLFLTTAPKSWDWEKLPVDVRGSLQKLLEHCTSDALNHRFPNFEPVLKALAELDPTTPKTRTDGLAQATSSRLNAPLPSSPPPLPPPSAPPETHAQKLRRYKTEATAKVDQARVLVGRYAYAEAVRILSDFTPEQLPYRDDVLLRDATAKRDRVAGLHANIQSILGSNLFNHPRLPVLLAEYLALKPDDSELRELAAELPAEEELPKNPKAGDVFALRAWISGSQLTPGEIMTLKALLPSPAHMPGELTALRWKVVAKRPNPNS